MEQWTGKVAVVTGASSGIGAAISVRLANLGLLVVGLARRKHLIDDLAAKVNGTGSIHGRQTDLSKPKDIRAAFKWIENEFGGIDILVNNAGRFSAGNLTVFGDKILSDEMILLSIEVNFNALVLCTRVALESMKKRNFEGHIINMNSVVGHYDPISPHANVYPATKHAITSFTSSLVTELARYKSKIKVTSLSPGVVNTDMSKGYINDLPVISPDDVADAVEYVVSTPPNINIYELGIKAVGEGML